MDWYRIASLTAFDLRCSILQRKGLLFLLPFFLFWCLVLRRFYDGIAMWLQSNDVLMLASTKFDLELVTQLFIDHPPSLSAFLIIGLYTMPFFAILAGNDMFASDLGNGYFRFLITRCHRMEIFLARYLSAFLLLLTPLIIVGLAATVISVYVESYTFNQALIYLLEIILIQCLYIAPYLAYVSIISILMNSALASMLLSMVIYVTILITITIADTTLIDNNYFSYLLPSGFKSGLIGVDATAKYIAILSLPLYTLTYSYMAWIIFSRRNL